MLKRSKSVFYSCEKYCNGNP